MGQCACKDCKEEQDETAVSLPNNVEQQGHTYRHVSSLQNLMNAKLAASIDKLVLDSLAAIRSFVDKTAWHERLLSTFPFLQDTLMALPEDFGVCAENSAQNSKDVIQHRNLCVVLGCLAEKMAGPSSIAISSESTLDYIIANLDESCHPAVSLFAIIALEKFAQTCENKEGCGIGDDKYSLAYDGCRQFIWHNAMHWSHTHPCWKPGDILGCLLDLENLEMVFSLNGYLLDPCTEVFQYSRSGFYAAASFMPFTHAIFNFGHTPFQYPPRERNFSTFNDKGHLADDMRVILPR
ncbi:unnamed protein product [Darwinula stevensoni]|uniref:SPRY domain-containing protein n=1 Tax=Darwinula stevensoni TaxID=69355 RepID=A0A7R8X0M5_9CRUS|nr:unnamed protein product [Darwinula stevensoni]CAG0881817.1 unnamed protein product [Darwinula stevensoni]